MADQKSQRRVDRLLGGRGGAEDLTNLFLFARDRCDGRESVQEIGDFVAHHNEREKGILTRETRDFFAIATFVACTKAPGAPPLNQKALPGITPQYLSATLRRSNLKTLRAQTKLSHKQANQNLKSIIDRLLRNKDGSVALPDDTTKSETDLLNYLFSHMIIRDAFSGSRLVDDFTETLKSNGLLSKEQLKLFPVVGDKIVLFALAAMHRSNIVMTDGSRVRLYAVRLQAELSISASVPAPARPNIHIACSMFSTGLNAENNCEPELLCIPDWNEVELEVNSCGKLALLK